MEIVRLEIDSEGCVMLPDAVMDRLRLQDSQVVPLIETRRRAYVMPNVAAALLLEIRNGCPPGE